jgi:nitroimidazol reductase NimA-like FMN-containing flavoprotein (pyridoxamine 5'-phosphate oxidase superfamily)
MASRRNSIELTDEERRAFLAEKKTIIIVSNGKDGYPHPMPMWFFVDAEGCVYCTTFSKSQKVLNYRRDPKATLLVESGIEYAELKGVAIYADAEIIEDTEKVIDTLANINAGGEQLTEQQREGMRKSAEKRVVLKFTPTKYVSWDHSKLGGVY